jgi:hypothetical protein
MTAGTALVGGVVFLASSQWFWGVFCLVVGIVLTYLALVDPVPAEVRELFRASEKEAADDRDEGER